MKKEPMWVLYAVRFGGFKALLRWPTVGKTNRVACIVEMQLARMPGSR